MAKWILTDHRIISSELTPNIPVAVVIDKSYSKMILDGMNDGRSALLKIEKLRQDKQELRNKILALEAKLARWAKHCEETGIGTPRPGGKRVRVITAPAVNLTATSISEPVQTVKHRNYKQKECPGCGTRPPHMFSPKSGRQVMCEECKRALKDLKKSSGVKVNGSDTIRTTWRGQAPYPGVPTSEAPKEGVITDKDLIVPKTAPVEKPKKLTVEEVLRLPDGPEKKALEAKFTVAEKMEAAKLRYKIERENWKKMRTRGFSLDNPIVGVGLPKTEPAVMDDLDD